MSHKKRAIAASLSLRFYEHDGWVKEELDACCTRGEFIRQTFVNFPEQAYYVLPSDASYDVDAILSKISCIERVFDEGMSDREIVEDRNW